MMNRCQIVMGFGLMAATMTPAENVAELGSVRLKGYLGTRLDAMIANHLRETDVDYITAPFASHDERNSLWRT